MSKPSTPAPVQPPQPDPPAAKAILGAEDTPVQAAQKRTAQRQSLRASYLTAAPGVGVNL